ncbi:MAG: phosphate acyltransferase PlsX [Gammaproteobacteria bacterium]|nr:phosphate acyltransferase PlsX [Gammaproteobacteria bacterium]
MVKPVTIAIDAMSGDVGVEATVPAALAMLKSRPDINLILVGKQELIEPAIAKARLSNGRVRIHDAREVVSMEDHPADALRKKKDSSMRIAIDLVKNGEAGACVSAGNTGALMATGRFVLKTVKGIDRPAIMTGIPTKSGRIHMLDLGANTGCTAEQLFQFGIMGSVVVKDIEGIDEPRIGLLNIGEESIKGSETVREAAELLKASRLNYVGFVEGDKIAERTADVIVCDGFSGNVALKTMEGTARLVKHFLIEEFKSGLYGWLAGVVAWPVLRSLSKRVDPRRYNGASLVGLNGIVIKSHGGADAMAFQQAIQVAILEVDKDVPEQIRSLMEKEALHEESAMT